MQSVFCSILLYPILFRNTLPSSGGSFDANSGQLRMVNGDYSPAALTSSGAWYNARVANVLTASEDIVAGKVYTTNICPKNWTLLTVEQGTVMKDRYLSSWNGIYVGWYDSSETRTWTSTYTGWWTRTALSKYNYKMYFLYYMSGTLATGGDGSYDVKHGQTVRCVAK